MNYLAQYLKTTYNGEYYQLFFMLYIGSICILYMTRPSIPTTLIKYSLPVLLNNNQNKSLTLNYNTISTIFTHKISSNDSFVYIKKQDQVEQIIWQNITVKSGDNLSSIFLQVGLDASDVYKIVHSGEGADHLLNLKPGQIIKFGFSNKIISKPTLKQLDLQLNSTTKLTITEKTTIYTAKIYNEKIKFRQAYAFGRITSSLFEAGLRANLSEKLMMELSDIFSWDIDFSLDLQVGDLFKLIYKEVCLDGNKIADGEILAAEITNKGLTLQAIRYTDDTGMSNFYRPNGESMHNVAFMRDPVKNAYISSRFNLEREHPILKTKRPHLGVDYAAAQGTPIMATGDGTVNFIGIKGGYGRTIMLTHASEYTTVYAHMSKYGNGIEQGKSIKRGDIIGYVGKSGLATGPHLHYEFIVNGIHHDPLSMTLPNSKHLLERCLSDFNSKMEPLVRRLNTLENNILLSK